MFTAYNEIRNEYCVVSADMTRFFVIKGGRRQFLEIVQKDHYYNIWFLPIERHHKEILIRIYPILNKVRILEPHVNMTLKFLTIDGGTVFQNIESTGFPLPMTPNLDPYETNYAEHSKSDFNPNLVKNMFVENLNTKWFDAEIHRLVERAEL